MNASTSRHDDEAKFPFLTAAGLESMIWENAELRRDVMGSPERWEEIRTSDDLLDKYFRAALANSSASCRHIFEWYRAAEFTWEKICPPPPTGRADGQEFWSREFYRKVLTQEFQCIENRRIAVESDQDRIFDQGHKGLSKIVGLSLSGGGIRSATFHLGVIQALHAKGVLRYVDYVSTVSGGGYVGATISALLRKAARPFFKILFPKR